MLFVNYFTLLITSHLNVFWCVTTIKVANPVLGLIQLSLVSRRKDLMVAWSAVVVSFNRTHSVVLSLQERDWLLGGAGHVVSTTHQRQPRCHLPLAQACQSHHWGCPDAQGYRRSHQTDQGMCHSWIKHFSGHSNHVGSGWTEKCIEFGFIVAWIIHLMLVGRLRK